MTLEEMKTPVATHEQVAARLKSLMEGPQDVSQLPVVYHRALDLTLHVGPMSGSDFQAFYNLEWMENKRYKDSKGEEFGTLKETGKTDGWLLEKAVWTSDGKRLDEATAAQMLAAPGCGPSNFALIQAAKKENPPRPCFERGNFTH